MTAENSREPEAPPAAAGAAREDALAVAELRGEVARLREEREAQARESAEQEEGFRRELDILEKANARLTQLADLNATRGNQTALVHELEELRHHAADLEQRLQAVLGSTTWTALEPVRRIVRLVRRQGGPAHHALASGLAPQARAGTPSAGARAVAGRNPSGGKPASEPRQTTPGDVARTAHEVIRRTGWTALHELKGLERELGRQPDSDANFFLSNFARLLRYSRYAAYSDAARAVDAITERLGSDLVWVERNTDEKVLHRFTISATAALTRVQRYEEARRLLDAVIERQREPSDLLRFRAQMCWPHDPSQARADLAECSRRGQLADDWLVLKAYLERHDGSGTPHVARALSTLR